MPNRMQNRILQITSWLIVLGISLSACQFSINTETTEPETTQTPTVTVSPTPAPLGSSANPYIIGFDASLDPQGANSAARQNIAAEIAAASGFSVVEKEYSTSQDLYQAFVDGDVHLAWFNPLTYIYLHEQNKGEVGLLTNHFGVYFYGVQFLANAESGFVSYFDAASNSASASAADALMQLDGKRPCWVDLGSSSGYILPAGILEENQIYPLPGAILQSHTAVVRALYIKGICDFGVTFSTSGDPRTSSAVTNDLPDASGRVMVIWQSPAEIPNMNLTYSTALPEETRQQFNDAFLAWIKSADAKTTLSAALDQYEVQDLRVVDDSIYDALRNAIDLSGTDVSQWIGR